MISPEGENSGDNGQKLPRKQIIPAFTKAWISTDSENHKIPISNYQKYYEALLVDGAELVKDTLKAQKDPSRLVNSEFDYEYCDTDQSRKIKRVSLPLHLAAATRSLDVIEVLLSLGAEKESQDSHGRNILHNLVTLVSYMGGFGEDRCCTMIPWLIENFGIDVVYRMSRQENKDGLRPVEYASQQNALQLMKTMLETRGLYVIDSHVRGDTQFLDMDVADYETAERHDKSPLSMLAYLDVKKMEDPESAKVILSPVITSWIAAKKKADTVPLVIWIAYRLLIFIFYIVVDVNVDDLKEFYGDNASSYICEDLGHVEFGPVGQNLVIALLSVGMLMSLTLSMVTFIRDWRLGLSVFQYNLFGKKNIVSNRLFFAIVEMVYCFVIICGIVLFFDLKANGHSNTRIVMLGMLRLVLPLLIVWLLIYFLQLVPMLGSFIISVQGMIGDMIKFILLFILIIFPFGHAFETFIMSNSKEGCIEAFSNPFQTCYTLFKMMLNMHDLAQHDIKNIGALYAMHVVFVFMVAVLLLNFLIAIMSSSASKMADNEKVLLTIDQISILNELEKCTFWARSWLYPILNKCGFAMCGKKVLVRFEKCRLGELKSKRSET